MTTRRTLAASALLVLAAALAGCASPKVDDYANERPTLSLPDYFNGTLDAWGMFQDRSGKVVKRFTVVVKGSWQGDEGTLDESFTYSDGKKDRRVWKMKALGNGRYEGTADDVVGPAIGEERGNAFHWTYTLRQPVDGKTYEVQMDDWMYLVDDATVLNRTEMSKFGLRVGNVTLAFRKR